MKQKIVVAFLALIMVIVLSKPFIAISNDDFGFAVSTRTNTHQRFERLFVLEK